MSEMTEKETYERFVEGMKKAISGLDQLAAVTGCKDFQKCARNLQSMLNKGKKMYTDEPLTRQQVLKMLDHWTEQLGAKQ